MISSEIVVLVTVCLLASSEGEKTKTGTESDDRSSKITFPNDLLMEQQRQQHQHRQNYHPIYSYNRRIPDMPHYYSFREKSQADYRDENYEELPSNYRNFSVDEIPLEFIKNINQYNVSDLLLNFVEGDMEYDEPILTSRFGEDYEARSAAVTPKPGGCTPELKTISLATSDDPSILFVPQCTKVERCGGCCSHSLLSCQPKDIETLSYRVIKTQYNPNAKKLKFLGKEIVNVEKHVKCKCDCKIKEEVLVASCNKYQEYRPSECRCLCTNTDEEAKCFKSDSKKLWNSDLCACQCRDMVECSTGYYFDQIECKCMPNPKRRFVSYNRRSYETESNLESFLPSDN